MTPPCSSLTVPATFPVATLAAAGAPHIDNPTTAIRTAAKEFLQVQVLVDMQTSRRSRAAPGQYGPDRTVNIYACNLPREVNFSSSKRNSNHPNVWSFAP